MKDHMGKQLHNLETAKWCYHWNSTIKDD